MKTQADHTENIKNLAISCNQLGIALSALNRKSQQQLELLQNLTKLSGSWNNPSPTPTEKLIAPLREELKEVKAMISLMNQKGVESDAKSWARAFIIRLFSPVTFFILFLIYSHLFPIKVPYETTKSLEQILEQTGWTNTKLQRVEKNLGTDPNQRRRR